MSDLGGSNNNKNTSSNNNNPGQPKEKRLNA